MKYILPENRIKSVLEKYLNNIEWSVDDVGDLVVWGNNERVFDTFDDQLSISPSFLEKMEGFFGEDAGDYLMEWFNANFDHPVTEWGEAEFYDEDDEDEEDWD